jgi:glycerate kinase
VPTAVIEMAAAAGLRLVPRDRRNPCLTTSHGVGELIKAALDAGAERILLGCGDSGINDGGAGMAEALGVRFLDR